MIDIEHHLIERDVNDPNDSEHDEYNVTVQFMAHNFNKLVERYNGAEAPELASYKQPFVLGDEECELDFCVWLANAVRILCS